VIVLIKRAILATPGRQAYERIYRSARLRSGYLTETRLAFYEERSELLTLLEWRSVLDVGSGTGHLLLALDSRRSDARLVGIHHVEAKPESRSPETSCLGLGLSLPIPTSSRWTRRSISSCAARSSSTSDPATS
jgi:hypothetical protein